MDIVDIVDVEDTVDLASASKPAQEGTSIRLFVGRMLPLSGCNIL